MPTVNLSSGSSTAGSDYEIETEEEPTTEERRLMNESTAVATTRSGARDAGAGGIASRMDDDVEVTSSPEAIEKASERGGGGRDILDPSGERAGPAATSRGMGPGPPVLDGEEVVDVTRESRPEGTPGENINRAVGNASENAKESAKEAVSETAENVMGDATPDAQDVTSGLVVASLVAGGSYVIGKYVGGD